jgi:hypothetical protein
VSHPNRVKTLDLNRKPYTGSVYIAFCQQRGHFLTFFLSRCTLNSSMRRCAPLRGLSIGQSAVLIFALTRPGIIKTTRNSNQINMAHAHTHASWVEKQQLHIYILYRAKAPPGHIGAHAQRSRSPQCAHIAHKCIQIYCTQQYLSGRIFLFDFWRQKESE